MKDTTTSDEKLSKGECRGRQYVMGDGLVYQVDMCAGKKRVTVSEPRKNGKGVSQTRKVSIPLSVMQAIVEDWLAWNGKAAS